MKRTLSIIIPVYSETDINTQLSRLPKRHEIIVVDGHPNATTLELISDNTIQKVHSEPGRAIQMNTGAKNASGEVLIFLHADTVLPGNFDHLITQAINNSYQAGAFDLLFHKTDGKPLILFSKITNWRSKKTRHPYGDQCHFITKKLFNSINGYPNIPICEDVALMQNLKQQKIAIFIINTAVITSARRYERSGFIRAVFRNWLLIFLYYLGTSPKLLKKLY